MGDLKALAAMVRVPHARALLALRRDTRAFVRVQFLAAGIATGLLPALHEPRQPEQLAAELGVPDSEILRTYLDLGVALRELARTAAGYRTRGRVARALASPESHPMRALVTELVDYHGGVYRDLAEHLRDGSGADYLTGREDLVAAASGLLEPVLGPFVDRVVRDAGAIRLLELGCGSGVYLRRAAAANPDATGVAVEIEPAVAAKAAQALNRWGCADRFEVRQGDARRLPAEIGDAFDVITLYNSVYYVDVADRVGLFASLRDRLVDGGRLVIVSMMHGSTWTSLNLSLVLAATRGCTGLPRPDALIADLRGAGFTGVTRSRLMLGEPLVALTAVRSG
jgi:4-hydroxy-2,2'-bipyrrole-5-carbaldehyde O-methyltransferase